MLCFVRFFFGFTEAPMYPSNAAFNNNWFAKSEKARAASFLLAGSYFGPVIAPFVSVYLADSFWLGKCFLCVWRHRDFNCSTILFSFYK